MPLEPNQNATTDCLQHCTVSDCSFIQCQLADDRVPIPLSIDCLAS